MFESTAYKEKAGPAGTGEWRDKMNNWSRNVFDGVLKTPEVPLDANLLLIEDGAQAPKGISVTWLDSVGLDKSVERRAIGVCHSAIKARHISITQGIRLLKPLTPRLKG